MIFRTKSLFLAAVVGVFVFSPSGLELAFAVDERANVLKPYNHHSKKGAFGRLPKLPSFRKKNWEGYLHEVGPVNLRFSDEEAASKRPPSPALPEFTMLSNEYDPYLIETPLPEDEVANREMLSEVTIELDSHVVVSGMIDIVQEKMDIDVERLALGEEENKVLRPEEVLIFFESDSGNSNKRVVLPFSPALPNPSPAPIPSRATFTREK